MKLTKLFKMLFLKIRALLKLLYFIFFELQKVKKAKVVFFFPFYHTGGAEKVHLNIVTALNDPNNYIFFTGESSSDNFKTQFSTYANTYEVFEFLNRNSFIKNLFEQSIARKLNASKNLKTIFGCGSFFFYEFLSKINNSVKKVDLIHAFSKPDYGIELATLQFVKYIDNRVVINEKTYEDFKELYNENDLLHYLDRIVKIENAINFQTISKKVTTSIFNIGFVGRWSKEKRPELFLEIAKKVKSNFPEIEFTMTGSGMEFYKELIKKSGIKYQGEIFKESLLDKIYESMNLILITSYREGFPIVIMEAMAKGVIPVVVDVGGLSEHIKDNYNGILINNNQKTDAIVDVFVTKIVALYTNKNVRDKLETASLLYAQKEFGIANFNLKYKKLLLNDSCK